MKFSQLFIAVCLCLVASSAFSGDISLEKLEFDSTKYIDIDELHRGMIGYGLTVFEGAKVEKFKVEVISIISNKSAGRNAFLIKVKDNEVFDIARGVQGCSGSPVFFDDRLAGAMSFGWNFQKEPLYGVTPIKQMLNVHKRVLAKDNKTEVANGVKILDEKVYNRLLAPQILSKNDLESIARASGFSAPVVTDGMTTLPVMVSFSGLNNAATSQINEILPGFKANVSNFTGNIDHLLENDRPKIERGSSLVIPIVSGDYNAAALGTVTEVIDDWVFAFGHAFNGTGQCNWPLATGYIHTFMSSTSMSFKLGQAVDVVGAVEADEVQAICGRLGKKVDTCKAHTVVEYSDVDETVEFNMNLVNDEMFVSSTSMISVVAPTLYRGDLPDLCTLEYDVVLDFGKYGIVNISDISSDSSTFDLSLDIVQGTSLVANSPWDKPLLQSVESKVRVKNQTSVAELDKVSLNNTVFYPGDTIKADIDCYQYRLPNVSLKAELVLPGDIPPGEYQLGIGNKRAYLANLTRCQPQKGFADTTEKIVKVLNERNQYRQDKIYMFIVTNEPGLAVEDESLPALPAGKAMLLAGKSSERPITAYSRMIDSITPCDYVFIGSSNMKIEIRDK